MIALVATERKPSTGLKHAVEKPVRDSSSRRDGEKTQHGIETTLDPTETIEELMSRRRENPARD